MTRNRPVSDQSDLGTDADAFTAFERTGWEHQAPTYDDVIGRVTNRPSHFLLLLGNAPGLLEQLPLTPIQRSSSLLDSRQ